MFLSDFQINFFEQKGSKKTESPKTHADTQQQKQPNCALSQFEVICGAGLKSKEISQSSAISSISLVTPVLSAQHRV